MRHLTLVLCSLAFGSGVTPGCSSAPKVAHPSTAFVEGLYDEQAAAILDDDQEAFEWLRSSAYQYVDAQGATGTSDAEWTVYWPGTHELAKTIGISYHVEGLVFDESVFRAVVVRDLELTRPVKDQAGAEIAARSMVTQRFEDTWEFAEGRWTLRSSEVKATLRNLQF